MGRKAKLSLESKVKAVNEYISGLGSEHQIATNYGVTRSSFHRWIIKYRAFELESLEVSHKNKVYPEELKMNAIHEYLNGKGTQHELCIKYKISSDSQLSLWIKKYNSHEKFKTSPTGGKTTMTKGRETTFEERIEIVKYCIEHDRNYNKTAENYHVSYRQAREWMVKYNELGIDALTDRRGKRKPEEELTEVELLKAQTKLLGAQNKRLEMEIDVLKKLEEIERRWV